MIKPYYEENGIVIYHGDCREILPELEPVDLVLTDPPYNVGINYGDNSNDKLTVEQYDAAIKILRTMCGNADWAILLGSKTETLLTWWNNFPEAKQIIVRVGASVNTVLGGFRPQYRSILVTRKSSKWWSDLWEDIRFPGEGYYFNEPRFNHPCHAPLRLMSKLIECLCLPEDKTLDPFCGTGTTLRAAKDAGRMAIGIEIEEKYCEIAVKRLAQGVLDFAS